MLELYYFENSICSERALMTLAEKGATVAVDAQKCEWMKKVPRPQAKIMKIRGPTPRALPVDYRL